MALGLAFGAKLGSKFLFASRATGKNARVENLGVDSLKCKGSRASGIYN